VILIIIKLAIILIVIRICIITIVETIITIVVEDAPTIGIAKRFAVGLGIATAGVALGA